MREMIKGVLGLRAKGYCGGFSLTPVVSWRNKNKQSSQEGNSQVLRE